MVFAWQPGGDGDSDGPLNAIAAAAERTQGEAGGRATIRVIVSSPGSEPVTMTGEIIYNDDTGRTRGALTVPRPGSDGSVEMQMIADETGPTMYMR